MTTIQVRKGKRKTTYRVELMREGFRVSKTFQTRKEAKLFAAQFIADDKFANTLTNQTAQTLTLNAAVQEYLSLDTGKDPSKTQRLNHWVSVLGDTPLIKIQKKHVRAALRDMEKSHAPATINRYKAVLSGLFSFANDEHEISHNPVKGIKALAENNERTRFLNENELARLIEAAKNSCWDRMYLLVMMAIVTGARRSEMINLTWDQINFTQRTAHLSTSKNGEQRILTLTNNVVEELMKFRGQQDHVFPHPSRIKSQPFKNFDYYWRKVLAESDVCNFKFHDLRHSCASFLAMSGASLLEIADILGHKSISVTKRYSHLCTEHKAKLTDKVFGNISNG
ncbi:tyrosine-type recombinase/integrase [Vibrio breoganii]|uniref:tyrosine-type recombinase/integrase n=1 Tax=Vibrio breoganii TaxID=553239 RepID=UPI000C835094|nr:site-specific integrase [Vibrio breoganii]PMK33047.1 integrase [Vibrio breoganii]